jgi:hypothetical protein
MSYYVYENWQAGPHKTVIHLGSCGFCNHGKGRAGGYDPKHAMWHGPFESLNAAEHKAKSLPGVVKGSVDRCVR